MVKSHFYQQLSINECEDAITYYEDSHYDEFHHLLFDQLLYHIRRTPFDRIIQNELQSCDQVYKSKEAHSLYWLYRADRTLIESKTIYSFRFANLCDPNFYRTFETKAHHLFKLVTGGRHGYDGWYEYVGKDLLNVVDEYLNIGKVVQGHIPHRTKLFINQIQERIDIQFDFKSINERISICFEPGYPATII